MVAHTAVLRMAAVGGVSVPVPNWMIIMMEMCVATATQKAGVLCTCALLQAPLCCLAMGHAQKGFMEPEEAHSEEA